MLFPPLVKFQSHSNWHVIFQLFSICQPFFIRRKLPPSGRAVKGVWLQQFIRVFFRSYGILLWHDKRMRKMLPMVICKTAPFILSGMLFANAHKSVWLFNTSAARLFFAVITLHRSQDRTHRYINFHFQLECSKFSLLQTNKNFVL